MKKRDKHHHVLKLLFTSFSIGLVLGTTFSSNILAKEVETDKESNYTKKDLESATPLLKLRIMETTDVHANLMSYDYYQNAPYLKVGLAKTATLVKNARNEVKNSVLVDNGDLIQGTPLGMYKAKINPLKPGEVHPIFKAMNIMKYDVATLGNHEFNYGLEYLEEAYNDANFPYINANVYLDDHDKNQNNDKNKFQPYKIIKKKVIDEKGKKHILKMGYIGFVPPQTNDWDKANLQGKVIVKDIVTTAKKFIPEIQKKGADLIVALAHTGFSGNKDDTENVVYALSEVTGIDAITFAHTHKLFPEKSGKTLGEMFLGPDKTPWPGVNYEIGTINGVPVVQGGFGGGSLGIIDLDLNKVKGKWRVVGSKSFTRQIWKDVTDPTTGIMKAESVVTPDKAIVNAVIGEHNEVINYVDTSIGRTTKDIHSYFALVQDDPSIQIVTNAQKWQIKKYIDKEKPELKNMPILSVCAPFKAGRNGVEDYTEIKKGDLTIRSAANLYLYDNTLKAIKVKGKVVKEWLEMSAGKFNQIDPLKTEPQFLHNPKFPSFNFDVIDGVQYQIDVTKPAKYDSNGNVINSNSSRISKFIYNGKPVDLNQEFIIVTNNYRAGGGGNFPGVKGSELVVDSADENWQVLMNYIKEVNEITPTTDNNWSIAPINKTVNVIFISSPRGSLYINPSSKIAYSNQTDDQGFGIYKLDLNQK
ncbi:bifunctional 2',3'-cyclic-nucleotide 2'-phosphodiesterase/3'-nucleotidase [Bacillus sp. 1NLA3E]|uniref:bifunctional 2',3'-cyclic-nucleotide 2'-phosphodiesterase/3'-nucleotidase n=1 Tax=Bacillus sp. 1NLA3E TaxID=666686 RepID=UPI000247F34F|nr:bifunctional 2',3'-cyclic-nucleotide 2'-phosphodiesterase/3'-nucleotidase [Bacillus sp. 1NLA3E]AGK53820.1 2',3'-cyclic-nucleotide 2'-phosphodiesterase [Bacillus sp. 1NLA3E]